MTTINCPIECVKDEPDFLEKHSTFVLTAVVILEHPVFRVTEFH